LITLCSLWDSVYHSQGMALIASLARHVPSWALYVLALDKPTYQRLEQANPPNVFVVPLDYIETPDLWYAYATRTWIEYIWTLGSVFTRYCRDAFDIDRLAYIDADCYLFGDLAQLYAEVGDAPVAITPHRWTPSHADRLRGAGVYNVGWVYFGEGGRQCLDDWATDCVDWCFHSVERDGRFADQGYLNDWPQQYNAHVVKHLGVNLAPWNQEQYTYRVAGGQFIVADGKRADPLLMYHFHGGIDTGYALHPSVRKHVYAEYGETCKRLADGTSPT